MDRYGIPSPGPSAMLPFHHRHDTISICFWFDHSKICPNLRKSQNVTYLMTFKVTSRHFPQEVWVLKAKTTNKMPARVHQIDDLIQHGAVDKQGLHGRQDASEGRLAHRGLLQGHVVGDGNHVMGGQEPEAESIVSAQNLDPEISQKKYFSYWNAKCEAKKINKEAWSMVVAWLLFSINPKLHNDFWWLAHQFRGGSTSPSGKISAKKTERKAVNMALMRICSSGKNLAERKKRHGRPSPTTAAWVLSYNIL